MSRRPRRNRPPRLDEPGGRALVHPGAVGAGGPGSGLSLAQEMTDRRVTGRHPHLGLAEVRSAHRRLVAGDPDALAGTALLGVTAEEVVKASQRIFGWNHDTPRAHVQPARSAEAVEHLAVRLCRLVTSGGTLAVATARPASLLPLYQIVAGAVVEAGGRVLGPDRYGPVPVRGRGPMYLTWLAGVAVATRDRDLVGGDLGALAAEWVFALGPRPDLVLADGTFAGAALADGCEVFAFADVDEPALAVAAARGLGLRVVPLALGAPAAAYDCVAVALAHRVAALGAPPSLGGAEPDPEPAPESGAAPDP